MAFVCFAHSAYSQNKYNLINSEKTKAQKIETSSELKMSKFDDQHLMYHRDIKKGPSNTKNNYQLKLHIEGEWWAMAIGNGDDFFDAPYQFMVGNTYEETLPEGYYDITISGYTSEWGPAFFFFEQVLINKNTELNANMADAVHKVEMNPVDINGNPLKDVELLDSDVVFLLFMHHSIGMTFQNSFGGFFPDIDLHVNDMGTRNKLLVTVDLLTTSGINYYYAMPMVEDGITENLVLTNQVNDVRHYGQKFNIYKELTEDTYSNMCHTLIFYDFDTEVHGYVCGSAWSIYRTHDKEKPYSLYTNVRYNDDPKTGDINLFISPIFYEFFDIYGNTDYTGAVYSMPIAINKNGELIQNFLSLYNDWAFNDGENVELTLHNNHLSRVWNKNEFYYEGYRTPHLYYQSSNYNAATGPYGFAWVRGGLLFQGEFNEQKYNHGDVMVKLTGDGTIVFNDSIFKFNDAYDIDATHAQYEMEITNDQVFAFGKNMTNHTRINFDLSKADANPPALTMLRVIDNEKISMSVLNPLTARLEITAGDFTQDLEKFWALKYVGKPRSLVVTRRCRSYL